MSKNLQMGIGLATLIVLIGGGIYWASGQKESKCPYCSQTFGSPSALSMHKMACKQNPTNLKLRPGGGKTVEGPRITR